MEHYKTKAEKYAAWAGTSVIVSAAVVIGAGAIRLVFLMFGH